MDQTEREVRRNILILEQEENKWKRWHCNNVACNDHVCQLRLNKLFELEYERRYLYTKLKFFRNNRKYF